MSVRTDRGNKGRTVVPTRDKRPLNFNFHQRRTSSTTGEGCAAPVQQTIADGREKNPTNKESQARKKKKRLTLMDNINTASVSVITAKLAYREGMCGLVAMEGKVSLFALLVTNHERIVHVHSASFATEAELFCERRTQALAGSRRGYSVTQVGDGARGVGVNRIKGSGATRDGKEGKGVAIIVCFFQVLENMNT